MKLFTEKVTSALNESGWSIRKLGRMAGISAGYAQQISKGQIPEDDIIHRVATVLNLDFQELWHMAQVDQAKTDEARDLALFNLSRYRESRKYHRLSTLIDEGRHDDLRDEDWTFLSDYERQNHRVAERGGPGSEPTMVVQVGNHLEKNFLEENVHLYRGIPLYESGRLSAGMNGLAFDPGEEPTSTVVVYRPELKGRSNHRLASLRVGGPSMEPVIPRHSIVVVDLSDRQFVDRRIYVVNMPENGLSTAAVKRVQKWERGFLLISENAADYPPVPSDMDWPDLCVGRVVWMWRDIEHV
jgi:phage repressor protein C with HTH and peptisase S24 domain/lambda repressor-like predicted transcriptional regulator